MYTLLRKCLTDTTPYIRQNIQEVLQNTNEDFKLSELFCRILPYSPSAVFCLQLLAGTLPISFYNCNFNLSDDKERSNDVILVLAEFVPYWPSLSCIGHLFPLLAEFVPYWPSLSSV